MRYLFFLCCVLTILACPSEVFAQNTTVTAPTVNDSYQRIQRLNQALLPSFAPEPLDPAQEEPNEKIGVKENFLLSFFKEIACAISGQYCPKELELASAKNKEVANQAGLLIKASRPDSVTPSPAPNDEKLGDIQTDDISKKALGNTDYNRINTSIGTPQGFFSLGIPKFPEYQLENVKENPENAVQKQLQTLTKSQQNIQYKGQQFEEDYRAADDCARENLFYIANYPPNTMELPCPAN